MVKMIIDRFENEHSFLSNFSESPITFQGKIWKTVEHLYQAFKAISAQDRETIRNCTTPGLARKLGRSIQKRQDWDSVKRDIMLACLILKFDQNPDLKEKLLATGDAELVESNWWHDNFFGQCTCNQCKNTEGKNVLGKLLMKLRADYRG